MSPKILKAHLRDQKEVRENFLSRLYKIEKNYSNFFKNIYFKLSNLPQSWLISFLPELTPLQPH